MTAKEYLGQAYHLNLRIGAKLARIASLEALAVKCTASLSGIPSGSGGSTSAMADAVASLVDLQAELNADIDRMIGLQREFSAVIAGVADLRQRLVLERRYLCYESFEKIAAAMGYSVENIFILHRKALKNIKIPESLQ